MQRAAVAAEAIGQFQEVQSFVEDDGVGAAVTARPANGRTYFSFKLFREHDKAGQGVRSNWFSRRHVAALRSVLNRIEDYLDEAEDRQRSQRR